MGKKVNIVNSQRIRCAEPKFDKETAELHAQFVKNCIDEHLCTHIVMLIKP